MTASLMHGGPLPDPARVIGMHRRLAIATALGLASFLALIAGPGEGSDTPAGLLDTSPAAAALRGDDRLDVPVTLAQEYTPLSRVLRLIQDRVGVKLAATGDTADDKVTLFLDRRPAREALALLARHLDFRWYRKGAGYELAQDVPSKRKEAELRARASAAGLAAIRDRMALTRRLAALPPEQLDRRQQEIGGRLADPAPPPAERESLAAERTAITDLLRPQARIFIDVWEALTPAQLAQLQGTGEVILSTKDGSLRAGVSERLVREGAEFYNRSVSSLTGETRDPLAAADAAHVRVRLLDQEPLGTGDPCRGDRRLRLVFEAATRHGSTGDGWRWVPRVYGASPEGAASPTETTDPALLRPVQLTLDQLKERGGAKQITIGPAKFARTQTLIPLPGLVRVLHQVSGLEFIVDGFIRARLDASPVATQEGRPKPVARILDAAAAALDYTWSKEGNVVRLRSRSYCFDRPAEVPSRILQPWIQRRVTGGIRSDEPEADLTDLSGLSAALTDAQCRGLSEFWDWYTEGTGLEDRSAGAFVYAYRAFLRLWAGLNPPVRKAVLAGGPVPVRTLDAAQQQALLAVFSAPAEHEDDFWWDQQRERRREPTPQQLTAGTLTGELEQFKARSRTAPGGGTAYSPAYHLDLRLCQGDSGRVARVAQLSRR